MTVIEALRSAQFVVDHDGHRTAVLLDIDAWDALIAWVEDTVDTRVATAVLMELEAAGGRPHQAGWLDWETVGEEWRAEKEGTVQNTTL